MHSSNSSAGAVTLKPKLKRASNEQPPQAKRRRRTVSSPPPERVYQHIGSPPSTPRKNTNSPLDTIQDKQSPVKLPTSAESWKWTFTKASVAPCFISDVLRLTDGKQKGDYFMLGRVPCRSVFIIGLVLGATAYEKRTLYIVDDGTGIINCIIQNPEQPPQSPKKDGYRTKRKRTSSEGQGQSRSPGPDDEFTMPYSKAGDANAENAELERGYVARITGIVRSWKGSKEIHIDEMERCTSVNDELEHWQRVLTLHQEHYDLTEPFIIPPPPIPAAPARVALSPTKSNHQRQVSSALPAVSTPKKRPPENVDPSPSGHSITYLTPTKSVISSPSRSHAGSASPIRLRNPSRLRTRELTVNTFRIYVKHYMDNTLPPTPVTASEADGDGDSDTSDADSVCISLGLGGGGRDDSTTRTQRERRPSGSRDIESTPRAKAYDPNWTPRAAHCDRDDEDEGLQAPHVLGFTLSYLRRVPELAELARRVVKAEARRREKEAHLASQEKSTGTANLRSSHRSDKGKATAYDSSSSKHGKEGLRPKMKRLFVVAIRKLFEEGSIVLWDGPVWPVIPVSPSTSPCRNYDRDGLAALSGKAGTSTEDASVSTNVSLSTMYSTRNGDGIGGERRDEGDLSDPQGDEESYIPLTPSYLGMQVLSIIRAMTFSASTASTTSRHRHNAGKKEVRDARSRGPTKEEITKYLNRMNSRWERVGAWSVQEALEWLQHEGRVQIMRDMEREGNDAGRVRWGLCS
ncbi:uncharacterized protein STEHIDRAFT_138004 [Stereum hirsutum FP-91666 SS1]|uniref:uncharacterized protein n=1 Tax=Stereum hirsutum (strain FP-91666) TaxID=721885 RepID=UPI000440E3AD|nr:uncharacterized protein STEHIDRAFT_138004 [Stereum hirsutum FP-91666 SS1]EIM88809.1 hypothetical protein STEHIDRAFT_138004 [Stereum hirsutum FP-91666 SS1]